MVHLCFSARRNSFNKPCCDLEQPNNKHCRAQGKNIWQKPKATLSRQKKLLTTISTNMWNVNSLQLPVSRAVDKRADPFVNKVLNQNRKKKEWRQTDAFIDCLKKEMEMEKCLIGFDLLIISEISEWGLGLRCPIKVYKIIVKILVAKVSDWKDSQRHLDFFSSKMPASPSALPRSVRPIKCDYELSDWSP